MIVQVNVVLNTDVDSAVVIFRVSLRANSPIWASEASLARARERAAKPRGQRKGELATISHKISFVLRSDEGKYNWLKNDVPENKVD